MKWILFAPKRKTALGQLDPGNQLSEKIANYKKYVLTIIFVVVTLLNSNKRLIVCLSLRPVWRVLLLIP